MRGLDPEETTPAQLDPLLQEPCSQSIQVSLHASPIWGRPRRRPRAANTSPYAGPMRVSYLLRTLALAAALAPMQIAWAAAEQTYAWRSAAAAPDAAHTLAGRIGPPRGFQRAALPPDSFAAWLRGLPLKPAGSPVLLHTGAPKARQDVHVAVVDIDVGQRDLQQCADAVMRLRAEWLFAAGRIRDIAFNDTGAGKPIQFARWAAGERPHIAGRSLAWSRSAAPDAGYGSFRRYMDVVFTWAGTYSLERELAPKPVAELAAGDLFIRGGFPGHAVLVADVAEDTTTGERRFLLLQSFMPAQEMHILENPANADGSPWYALDFGDRLVTPEWVFPRDSLRTWR